MEGPDLSKKAEVVETKHLNLNLAISGGLSEEEILRRLNDVFTIESGLVVETYQFEGWSLEWHYQLAQKILDGVNALSPILSYRLLGGGPGDVGGMILEIKLSGKRDTEVYRKAQEVAIEAAKEFKDKGQFFCSPIDPHIIWEAAG